MSRGGQSVRISFVGTALLVSGNTALVTAKLWAQASLPVCSNGHCDK